MSEENVVLNEVQRAVEQLRQDGYQVRFTHWRQTYWDEQVRYSRKVKWMREDGTTILREDLQFEDDYGEPMSNGGMTQCIIIFYDPADDKFELVTRSHTNCSKDDQFCYAQGRRISLARAINQMVKGLPYLDAEVYNPFIDDLHECAEDFACTQHSYRKELERQQMLDLWEEFTQWMQLQKPRKQKSISMLNARLLRSRSSVQDWSIVGTAS